MGLTLLICLAIVGISLFLTFLIYYKAEEGTDHWYHLSLIKGIKQNKNKFIYTFPYLVNTIEVPYPQLPHWILSHFNYEKLQKSYRYYNLTIALLSIVSFLIFLIAVHPYIPIAININWFIVYSSLFYLFTPFSNAFWNNKNSGLSLRATGIFFGQLYFSLLIFFQLSDNYIYIAFLLFLSLCIWMSSQFAQQVIVFTSIPLALFFKSAFLVLIPIGGLLLFFIIMPKIAKTYFIGSLRHKKIFFKLFAHTMLFSYRSSVWGDFVSGFWTKPIKGIAHKAIYFLKNPIINIIVGIPLTLPLIFLFFIQRELFSEEMITVLGYVYLSTLLVFFLTTFRITRFLGEPERYVEYSLHCQAILWVVFLLNYPIFFYSALALQILFGSLNILINFYKSRRGVKGIKSSFNDKALVQELMNLLNKKNEQKNIKIFCNQDVLSRRLMIGDYKIALFQHNQTHMGKFHFWDLYEPSGDLIKTNILLDVVSYYKIDYFIFYSNNGSLHLPEITNQSMSGQLVTSFNDIQVYQFNHWDG